MPEDLARKLCGTTDAKVWAEEWVKVVKENPAICTDEATMLSWFANAIMAGYDCGYQRALENLERTVEKSTARFMEELELEQYRNGSRAGRKLRLFRGLLRRLAAATMGQGPTRPSSEKTKHEVAPHA